MPIQVQPQDVAPPGQTTSGIFGKNKLHVITWFLLLVLVIAAAILTERVLTGVALRKEGPLGDVQVYFRAAWAVRAGQDMYQVIDLHGWHYHYPPFFAILLAPLADAPPGADRAGLLPFAVSVMIWYAVSVLFLLVAVHLLALALKPVLSDVSGLTPPDRWWLVRAAPVAACLPAIAWTLTRGQVSLVLLLCLSAMLLLFIRGRSLGAGLCLGVAVCVKIIPAFLLIYPLWRRDWRFLVGCAATMVLGLAVLPSLAFGPERTVSYYQEEFGAVFGPGLGLGQDAAREQELFSCRDNYSQSFLVLMHNLVYPDRATRPDEPAAGLRIAHWLISAALTILTLLVYRKHWPVRGTPDPVATMLVIGQLMLLLPQISPICHAHYFVLALPTFLTLYALALKSYGWPRINSPMGWLFITYLGANALPWLPNLGVLRDGLPGWANLALWLIGLIVLWRWHGTRAATASLPLPMRPAA
jgi:hypothetical protein